MENNQIETNQMNKLNNQNIKKQTIMAEFLKPSSNLKSYFNSKANENTQKNEENTNTNGSFAYLHAPQVTVSGGKIIIDQSSLIAKRNNPIESMDREVVEETQKHVTSASFRNKKTPRDKWTVEDTEKFYLGIRMCGTDFGMISSLIKTRTREQIKNKYKKEDKLNPHKIQDALNKKKKINLSAFN